MSDTFKDQRKYRQKAVWRKWEPVGWLQYHPEYTQEMAENDLWDYKNQGRVRWGGVRKRAFDRRLRHQIKNAIRHGDFDRVFRKWNGSRKIKTGYSR